MPFIPSTVDYNEYIKSDKWRAKARAAKERACNCCQLCRSTILLNVHHNTYQRLGDELDSDLIVLCRACHEIFHGSRDARTMKKNGDAIDDPRRYHALHSPPTAREMPKTPRDLQYAARSQEYMNANQIPAANDYRAAQERSRLEWQQCKKKRRR